MYLVLVHLRSWCSHWGCSLACGAVTEAGASTMLEKLIIAIHFGGKDPFDEELPY